MVVAELVYMMVHSPLLLVQHQIVVVEVVVQDGMLEEVGSYLPLVPMV
jgi:hypothetical protein